jgi:hypothetical protein
VGRRARARVAALEWDEVARRFAALVLGDPRNETRTSALAQRHPVPRMEDAT